LNKKASKKRQIFQKKHFDYEDFDVSSSTFSKRKTRGIERKFYQCEYEECGKIFSDKGAYKKHELTHGEKQVFLFVIFSTFVIGLDVGRNS
jgi:hypothetical protein